MHKNHVYNDGDDDEDADDDGMLNGQGHDFCQKLFSVNNDCNASVRHLK